MIFLRFFSPWGLAFLISIPIVILMYMLRQKFQEHTVSNIYLWEQALADIEADTPWQKLKKNMLLLLQLLALLLIIFALSDPFVSWGSKGQQNLIIVIDNSGSMNAIYKSDITRIDAAKKHAEDIIKRSSSGTKFTIVEASKDTKLIGNAISDKSEAIKKVNTIKRTNSSGTMEDAAALVKALGKQYSAYKAVFLTDTGVNIGDMNADIYSLSSKVDNVSLDYIAHSAENDSLRVLVRVTNRSDVAISREIALFGEDKLVDLQNVELKGKETKTIYFAEIPAKYSYIYAEIEDKDGLGEDNVIYDVVKLSKGKKVLLASDNNIFIEKSLSLINDVELYKTTQVKNTADEYDLYIYDGIMPDKLPLTGSIMIVNPASGNEMFKVNGDIAGGMLRFMTHPVTKYINDSYSAVSKLKSIEVPYWADTIIKSGENPAAFVGKYKGRNIAVIGFDFHSSDLVLTPEYPILMNNLMNYLMSTGADIKTSSYCGEPLEVQPLPDAKAISIEIPSGREYNIELDYPMIPFLDMEETGIYRMIQKNDREEIRSLFAVNFPCEDESNIDNAAYDTSNRVNKTNVLKDTMGIQTILLLIGLILLSAEWVVYTHDD